MIPRTLPRAPGSTDLHSERKIINLIRAIDSWRIAVAPSGGVDSAFS